LDGVNGEKTVKTTTKRTSPKAKPPNLEAHVRRIELESMTMKVAEIQREIDAIQSDLKEREQDLEMERRYNPPAFYDGNRAAALTRTGFVGDFEE
jgi:hypothetical protein